MRARPTTSAGVQRVFPYESAPGRDTGMPFVCTRLSHADSDRSSLAPSAKLELSIDAAMTEPTRPKAGGTHDASLSTNARSEVHTVASDIRAAAPATAPATARELLELRELIESRFDTLDRRLEEYRVDAAEPTNVDSEKDSRDLNARSSAPTRVSTSSETVRSSADDSRQSTTRVHFVDTLKTKRMQAVTSSGAQYTSRAMAPLRSVLRRTNTADDACSTRRKFGRTRYLSTSCLSRSKMPKSTPV
jgi:hypothetical protein